MGKKKWRPAKKTWSRRVKVWKWKKKEKIRQKRIWEVSWDVATLFR